MKAADPTIEIGSIGPFSSTDQSYNNKDQLSTTGLLNWRKDWCKGGGDSTRGWDETQKVVTARGLAGAVTYWNAGTAQPSAQSWYARVASVAAGAYDFVSPHRYDVVRKNLDFSKPITWESTIVAIRGVAGRKVALTEYNVGSSAAAALPPHRNALVLAEQMIQMVRAGVFMATQWPLQGTIGSGNPLLDWRSNGLAIHPAGEVFKVPPQRLPSCQVLT